MKMSNVFQSDAIRAAAFTHGLTAEHSAAAVYAVKHHDALTAA